VPIEVRRVFRVFPHALLACVLALPLASAAHPDLDEQLSEISTRLAGDPCDAALHLRRGELHRVRREWARAVAAYDRAAECNPSLDTVDVARGELYLDSGSPIAAKTFFDRFLAKHPDAPAALIGRARCLARLGRADDAATDFNRALPLLPTAKPDVYLERAQAQIAAGRDDAALRGLEDGVARLGLVPALERLAIDLELKHHQYDAALKRLDELASRLPNRETWLLRRAEVLEMAGRPREAFVAYDDALAAIVARPPHRRTTTAMRQLEQQAKTAAGRLAAVSSSGRP